MNTSIILLLAVFGCVYGQDSTPVQQCGTEKLFRNVAIYTHQGLCTQLPCRIKMGSEITVVVEFETKNVVEKMTTECVARALGTNHRLPIPDADKGCDYLIKGKCPVPAKSIVVFKRSLKVEAETLEGLMMDPENEERLSLDARLEAKLRDQNKKDVSCFRVNVKLSK